ncbi:MAG: OmpH family outer membrane protein [Saprospiraceae bacterium]
MRKILQLSLLGAFLFMLGSTGLSAQQIAFVDSEKLLAELPARKIMMTELENYRTELEKELEVSDTEFKTYVADVMNKINGGELSPKQQTEAEAEIQTKQQNMKELTAQAEFKLAQKEQELSKPIIDKFNAALKAVAEEKGYAYIVDKKMFLYMGGGIDATEDIKAKM